MDVNMNFMEYEQHNMFSANYGRTEFSEFYRCHSLHSFLSSERKELDYAGKIILPQSALAKLAALHIEYPMLFILEHENSEKHTHAGVLEFTAPEGKMYVPSWILKQLNAHDGDIIKITSTTLSKGSFLKIQPQSVDFLDISDPKAVLENALRQYSALTEGDIITIFYNRKIYELLCMEVKPLSSKKGISIFETDLNVDFAPPVGYVDPSTTSRKVSSAASEASRLSVEEHKVQEDKWSVFSGSGSRLSGKPSTAKSLLQTHAEETGKMVAAAEGKSVPDALRLPTNKLWFGYKPIPLAKKPQPGDKTGDDFKGSGSGFSLRR